MSQSFLQNYDKKVIEPFCSATETNNNVGNLDIASITVLWIRVHNQDISYFKTKTYVAYTQKSRLHETVLLAPHTMLKLMFKNIITFLPE